MKAKDLRNSILMMAVQGKLVEQNSHDEPASVLLKKAIEIRQLALDKKEIRREEIKGIPEVISELPSNWVWARLTHLCLPVNGAIRRGPFGSAITKDMFVPKEDSAYKVYEQGNAIRKNIEYGDYYITAKHYDKLTAFTVFPGDIIISCAGTIGETYELPANAPKGIINQALLKLTLNENIIYKPYFLILFESIVSELNCNSKGSAMKNLASLKYLKNDVKFPLPPFTEQQRIVAKLEELMPQIDKYEQAETTLTSFEQEFPDKMRSSILQAAVQGKLVAQNPQDEPASVLLERIRAEKTELIKQKKIKKEKPLPEITEEEKPFDLPAGWEWVHLNDILDVRDGTHDTPAYVPVGVPLVTSKNLDNGKVSFANIKYISKEDSMAINQRSGVDNGDILFAMIGSIGNPVVVYKEKEFSIKNVALFKNAYRNFIDINFIYYVLIFEQDNMKKMASGGVQAFVSLTFLRKYVIALPPLAEQKRIVAKVEKMLSLCDCLQEA